MRADSMENIGRLTAILTYEICTALKYGIKHSTISQRTDACGVFNVEELLIAGEITHQYLMLEKMV